jgi:hypothetical protein
MAKTNFKFNPSIVANLSKESYARFYTYLADGNWLIDIVKSFLTIGISPVYKVGRFQKYSESYKLFLQGKIRFVTMNGAVRAIFPYKTNSAKGKKGEHSPLNIAKGKYGGTRIVSNKAGTSGKLGKFPLPYPDKKLSPVSMTASGDMLNSMYLEKTSTKVKLGFTDKKAIYHNDMGAGKSRVIRRLLPTKSGEKFITNIDSRLKRLGKLAVQNSLANNKSLLVVKYVFKGK